MFIVIALNLAIGFVIPNVAWQAHLGGLVAGVAIAMVYVSTRRRAQRTVQILGVVGVFLGPRRLDRHRRRPDAAMTAHDDAEVCYRHPDRPSWTLCERCGRTICPECQIPTPNGVHCPDCVRETAGPLPAGLPPVARRAATSPRTVAPHPGLDRVGAVLVPDSGAPVITWGVVAALVVIFIVDLFLQGVLFLRWRHPRSRTLAAVALRDRRSSPPDGFSGLGLVFNVVFFLLVAPTIERLLGRARFVPVLLAAIVVGAAMLIAASRGPAFGMTGALFGLFAAFFVWRDRAAPRWCASSSSWPSTSSSRSC